MTNAAEPLVSVVTPFYNTEDYLAECIESVLAQTYRTFEYILVNNCSTDRSVEIVERYARRDPRIRLFHNERFVGQIRNYNQAILRISPTSRYFKLVQADDSIFPSCLEKMVAVAEASPSVAVVSSYRMVGSKVRPNGLCPTKTVMTGREACRLCLIEDVSLFGSQTTVMVRADIVRARNPFYPEDSLFPDSDVIYDILRDHDFAFVQEPLSFTRLDETSTWGKVSRYDPMLLDRVIRLKLFGRHYLTPEECERYLEEHRRAYRLYLALAWLQRREPEFWEYHRKGLATIGEEITRAGLIRDSVLLALHHCARPKGVIAGLKRRLAPGIERR